MASDAEPPVPSTRPAFSFVAGRRLTWLAYGCAVAAGILAASGLIGWMIDSPALEHGFDGLVTMKPYTAIALLLLTLACFVTPRVAGPAAWITVVVGSVVIVEYVGRVDLHVDQLLLNDPDGGPHPGRMAFLSAVCLVLLGAARILLGLRRTVLAESSAFLALLISALTLLGYAYGVRSLYRLTPLSTVALPAALACALLGVATMSDCPGGRLRWAASSRDAGATLVRRLLPLALIGLPVLGYGCLAAERAGLVSGGATLALMVIIAGVAVSIVAGFAALTVSRIDRRRTRTLAELTEFKNDLERQVGVRAAQLDTRRNQVAILQDRQRIAADLHDIVIQRLFATGMHLQTTALRTDDEVVQERLASAVQALDAAIKDLRGSIFELGRGAGRHGVDLADAVREICEESSRVLGFAPIVDVDEFDGAADAIRDDILAVLRESLSNVARHAGASRVEVAVRLSVGMLSLQVGDDGSGMTKSAHSSGTRNLAERARRLGGTCEWTSVRPHGTQLLWRVPLPRVSTRAAATRACSPSSSGAPPADPRAAHLASRAAM